MPCTIILQIDGKGQEMKGIFQKKKSLAEKTSLPSSFSNDDSLASIFKPMLVSSSLLPATEKTEETINDQPFSFSFFKNERTADGKKKRKKKKKKKSSQSLVESGGDEDEEEEEEDVQDKLQVPQLDNQTQTTTIDTHTEEITTQLHAITIKAKESSSGTPLLSSASPAKKPTDNKKDVSTTPVPTSSSKKKKKNMKKKQSNKTGKEDLSDDSPDEEMKFLDSLIEQQKQEEQANAKAVKPPLQQQQQQQQKKKKKKNRKDNPLKGGSSGNAKGPTFITTKSSETSSLTEKEKLKIKYGQGKNLVAVGPNKVKDPNWLAPPPGLTKEHQTNQVHVIQPPPGVKFSSSSGALTKEHSNTLPNGSSSSSSSSNTFNVVYHQSPFTFSFSGL